MKKEKEFLSLLEVNVLLQTLGNLTLYSRNDNIIVDEKIKQLTEEAQSISNSVDNNLEVLNKMLFDNTLTSINKDEFGWIPEKNIDRYLPQGGINKFTLGILLNTVVKDNE